MVVVLRNIVMGLEMASLILGPVQQVEAVILDMDEASTEMQYLSSMMRMRRTQSSDPA